MSDRVHAATSAALWRRERLDVVAVQETFVDASNTDLASKWLLELGYTVFWNTKRLVNSDGTRARRCGGTAIAILSSLLAGGEDAVLRISNLVFSDDGRLTSARIQWGGHSFTCLSLYLPSANATAQKQFITRHLHSPENVEREYARDMHLWLGDFNFVCDASRDCVSTSNPVNPRPADAGVAQHWNASSCQHLSDVFRARHPTQKKYTFLSRNGGARLDRIYASAKTLEYISRSEIPTFTTSDHRLVTVDLLSKLPADGGGRPDRRQERRLKIGIDFIANSDTSRAFAAWLTPWADSLPASAEERVAWFEKQWPKLQRKIKELNATARQAALVAAHAYAPGESLKQLMELIDNGEEVNLERLIGLQTAHRSALLLDASQRSHRERLSWIHAKECASVALTRALNASCPKGPPTIPAVRLPDGRLTTNTLEMSKAAIDFTASISGPRSPQQQAEADLAFPAVAAAMLECGHPRIEPTSNTARELKAAGSAVTEEQVAVALANVRKRTSSGPDGIRPEVFTEYVDVFKPLFAKLFSAILSTKSAPRGFMDGIVIYIYKGSGERCSIGNYRPITLLNTVYRLFAKTLAHILNPRMATMIDQEQKGFLVGRQIGEVIITIQAAQALLESRGDFGCLIFADFMKAYDTVDREFLLRVMTLAGVPEQLCLAVRVLLTNTRARASVNGVLSPWVDFHAGVRQGCPLAPLLYLFVAEALHCVLATKEGVGIQFPLFGSTVSAPGAPADGPSVVVTAPQYADDITTLVHGGRAADADPQLLRAGLANARLGFDLFGRASGQRLNTGKTHLLPIGCLPAQQAIDLSPGAVLEGFTVVPSASTLGVTFVSGGGGHVTVSRGRPAQTTPWTPQEETRLEKVERTLQMLGGMQLSLLGRAMASGVYCTSKIFYHLEYRLPVPAAIYARLNSALASLLSDKHRDGRRPFYAIAQAIAAGRAIDGGLGTFPWDAHIASRHAQWAAKLLSAPLSVAWAGLLRALLLDHCGPDAHPIMLFDVPPELCASTPGLGRLPAALGTKDAASGPWNNVPSVLARLALGARALGPLRRLAGAPAVTGGGLELPAPLPVGWSPPVHLLVQRLQAATRAVHTVGFKPHVKSAGVSALHVFDSPVDDDVADQPQPRPRARKDSPSPLTVRAGTQLLVAAECAPLRRRKWDKFLQVAAGLHCDGETAGDVNFQPPALAASPAAAFKSLQALFKRLWRLSWSNQRKEIFWRLVYHGVPTAVRLRQTHRRCPCGALPNAPAGRPHVFWECPIAVTVREHIVAAIVAALPPAAPGVASLSREHLWLCRPPQPGISQHFWDVICVAALGAMEYGRRVLMSISLRPREVEEGGGTAGAAAPRAATAGRTRAGDPLLDGDDSSFPLLATSSDAGDNADPPAEDPAAQALLRAQRAAVAHFYGGLADFCHTTQLDVAILRISHSREALEKHPLLCVRARPAAPLPNPAAGAAAPPPAERRVSSFAVALPPSAKLPQRGDLREMALSRAASGPSSSEILKARSLDHNVGEVILSPAVFRGGVINKMVLCVCGSWRSALLAAEDDRDHVPCGPG